MHNCLLFCVGFEEITFEGAIDMIKSTYEDNQFSEAIGDPDGRGMYAAGVHIIHTWVIPSEIELTDEIIDECKSRFSSQSMFFRLASKDTSFKALTGHLKELEE